MKIEDIDLQEVERIAAAGYTPKQAAFMLGISPMRFDEEIRNEASDISIAYFKGLLSSELSVRESIFALARSGSSPAQAAALKIFDGTKHELRQKELPGFD
jgi:hypothetical protein